MKQNKIGVLLIARNEENYIIPTLTAISQQTIKPVYILVINDGSKDTTKDKILQGFPQVIILDYPYQHESYVNTPNLSKILNHGLNKLKSLDLDYVLIMGADQIIPKNYIEILIKSFDKDKLLVIASGVIINEFSLLPRGSGRLYRNSFLKKIGYCFKVNYGSQDYHFYKALQLKYKILTDHSLLSTTQRKTGSNYPIDTLMNRGRTFRALGYSKLYMMIYFITKHDGKSIKAIQKGYDDSTVELYEPDLRSFVSSYQKKQLFNITNIKKRLRKTIKYLLNKIKPRYVAKGNITTEKIKKMYLKGGARHKFYGMDNNELREKLRAYCITLNTDSVFEFGCNVGMNLKAISNNHYGIDINKQAIKKGQSMGLNVELGDEKTLYTIKDNSFDLVLTSSVLDHILEKDFEPIFNNLKRITKKYLVCLETNDEINIELFAHDYSSMVPMWKHFSSKESGGNGTNYTCYLWEKKD